MVIVEVPTPNRGGWVSAPTGWPLAALDGALVHLASLVLAAAEVTAGGVEALLAPASNEGSRCRGKAMRDGAPRAQGHEGATTTIARPHRWQSRFLFLKVGVVHSPMEPPVLVLQPTRHAAWQPTVLQ
jgi:hypothetical protein